MTMTTDYINTDDNNRARTIQQTMSTQTITTGLGQRQQTMSKLTITTGLGQ